MSLDERLRVARPAVVEVPVDLEGILHDAMRGGVRRRRTWKATALLSVALLLALVSIPVVRNVSRRNADVADRIQREQRNKRDVREDSSKGSATRSSSIPRQGGQSSNGEAPAARPQTEVGPSIGRVAFVAGGSDDVYVMNLDGSQKTRLGPGLDPDWSPDGERIVYASGDTGVCSTPDTISSTTVEKPDPCEVWVMQADGSNKRRLAVGGSPTWSPDGRLIAYVGGPTGDAEIYVMNADGSGNVRLT
ncbi:MAG: TolB family protein, partial [Candidatus Binatia bacterium]